VTAKGALFRPTREDLEAARTPAGGYLRSSLEAWGIPWPPPKGWAKGLLRDQDIPSDAQHPIERGCPTCGAAPGAPCDGRRGARKAFHRARGGRRRSSPILPTHDLETESPIEEALAGAIRGWIDHHESDASLSAQVPIGPYRADILIEAGGRKLVVECDGAAFHNGPEAVARDKRRDRYCATQGMAVMRFSGAEIKRDPRGCAAEVGIWIRAQR
jgi:very-short-patch-repair endonuclease